MFIITAVHVYLKVKVYIFGLLLRTKWISSNNFLLHWYKYAVGSCNYHQKSRYFSYSQTILEFFSPKWWIPRPIFAKIASFLSNFATTGLNFGTSDQNTWNWTHFAKLLHPTGVYHLHNFHEICSSLADIRSWQVFKIWCILVDKWQINNPQHSLRPLQNLLGALAPKLGVRSIKVSGYTKLLDTLYLRAKFRGDWLTYSDVKFDTSFFVNVSVRVCVYVCMLHFGPSITDHWIDILVMLMVWLLNVIWHHQFVGQQFTMFFTF